MLVGVFRPSPSGQSSLTFVVPMLVGVFRNVANRLAGNQDRCPHARGGVPDGDRVYPDKIKGCPHARGGVPV